ncbi:lipopolysaccharide heptosyltransferase II [Schlesneria paludicola]|uniref:lipopolysaccharide heptosyltransferase II n=1 Tax=Schlesneria paludicola TaxID=360056 RepID=UPI00029A5ADF|nr:lipopolysaccharide heptosyltransferase II [Schlesneria paludicola]
MTRWRGRPLERAKDGKLMKLAIFLPNWIGDAAMATPALRAVRNQFPDAEIVGVMRPYVSDVLAGTDLLDRTLFYHPRGRDRSQRGLSFIRALRAERFDVALLLPNSLRTGWLAWLSGARRRIGFARDLRSLLLTDGVVPKSKSIPNPVLDEYLRLASVLGCSNDSRQIELAVRPQDQDQFDGIWSRLNQSRSDHDERPQHRHRSFVCLNTGGAFGAAKNWPREYFAELARRIVTQLDQRVLVACGPSERDDARWIAETADHPAVFSLADEVLSIGLTKAAVSSADLLVTTDSGPRHFAAAFGTPVVTLFGPTHIEWSETNYEFGEHLQLKLDCGPCQQRECPLKHHRCLRDLSVDHVFAAVRRQLGRQRSTRDAA